MADVELVIKISEEDYEKIKKAYSCIFGDIYYIMQGAIAKGKPLPKGHSRLIDADELTKEIKSYIRDTHLLHYDDLVEAEAYNSAYYNCLDEIEDAPTIIEVDAESEEAKCVPYKKETLEMTIQEVLREPCEDAVDRLDALAIISTIKSNHIEHNVPINYGTILDIDIALQKLSSVTPIRKEGKPIYDIDSQDWSFNRPLKCPFCDERFGFDNNYNYCPNCGAKMNIV